MNKNNVLVSAILPVYNVQEYLSAAVESLINQTYKNIEIILVDDGSGDNSGDVCDMLAEKFDNVVVIHKENGGAAEARNTGLDISQGKYVYFMDPDDWMKQNMIEAMVNSAEIHQSQLVMTGFTNVFEKNKTEVSFGDKVYQTSDEFRQDAVKLLNNTMLAVPWNKLYLKTYLTENNLKFPNVKWDDLHFNLEVVRHIQHVSVIDVTDYQFLRFRGGSESNLIFNRALFQHRKDQFKHILDVFNEWDVEPEVEGLVNYYFIARICQVVQEVSTVKNENFSSKCAQVIEIISDEMTMEAANNCGDGNPLIVVFKRLMVEKRIKTLVILGMIISHVKTNYSGLFHNIRIQLMKV